MQLDRLPYPLWKVIYWPVSRLYFKLGHTHAPRFIRRLYAAL